MATLVLSTIGYAIGAGLAGPIGGTVGRIGGALLGSAIDGSFLDSQNRAATPTPSELAVTSAEEGRTIPRIYGRMLVPGQIIWAAPLQNTYTAASTGGSKGGSSNRSSTTQTRRTADFALALCEGPIRGIGRIWANEVQQDLEKLNFRLYPGTSIQTSDPLMIAALGADNVPSYRGTAYLVFEGLDLAPFHQRIPQFSVEVFRPIGKLERSIRAICLIPGAGEYVYSPTPIVRNVSPGHDQAENSHQFRRSSNWHASLDELQSMAPSLKSCSLVVSWFGNDLRVGDCILEPKIERSDRSLRNRHSPVNWQVGGISRAEAHSVSTENGEPSLGGTPDDQSVIDAILDLKARNLSVTLYPFLLMDIDRNNQLPDPYGNSRQAAYPWRGRITCHPAPGQDGSPDTRETVRADVNRFFGSAQPGDFRNEAGTIIAPKDDEGYRRFILHYAHLAKVASGVDAFLIGSEMVSLTRLRSSREHFPAVEQLKSLASDVRSILGAGVKIGYAADWSELCSYRPDDGKYDLFFHLDQLWSSSDIDFIGIDAYAPLADWRDEADHADTPLDPSATGYGEVYIRNNILGGEGFDWWYPSARDRENQTRSEILDTAYGKHWVFRSKGLPSWWKNQHFDRLNGREKSTSTTWSPRSKPIWITELGVPAVDKGANGPNAFPDPLSSENQRPPYSRGFRDDAAQRAVLGAVLNFWHQESLSASSNSNPRDGAGKPMIDPSNVYLWAWDARPFPEFPNEREVWRDGDNWRTGHWLNGRLGQCAIDELTESLAQDFKFSLLDKGAPGPTIGGLRVGGAGNVRNVLEGLCSACQFSISEHFLTPHRREDLVRSTGLRRTTRTDPSKTTISTDHCVSLPDHSSIRSTLADSRDIPTAIAIRFFDSENNFEQIQWRSEINRDGLERTEQADLDMALAYETANTIARNWLRGMEDSRCEFFFSLPISFLHISCGDIIVLEPRDQTMSSQKALVFRIEEGWERRLGMRRVQVVNQGAREPPPEDHFETRPTRLEQPHVSQPRVLMLELPARHSATSTGLRAAVICRPWPGSISMYLDIPGSHLPQPVGTFGLNPTLGITRSPLNASNAWRWDRGAPLEIELLHGTLESVSETDVLDGANLAAIGDSNNGFEIVQFAKAQLVGTRRWHLSHRLRGQGGTENLAMVARAPGAWFVLMDDRVIDLDIPLNRIRTAIEVARHSIRGNFRWKLRQHGRSFT